jgi:hypothetical protein
MSMHVPSMRYAPRKADQSYGYLPWYSSASFFKQIIKSSRKRSQKDKRTKSGRPAASSALGRCLELQDGIIPAHWINDHPNEPASSTHESMREKSPRPADAESAEQHNERQRIPLFNAMYLRQDIGGGDGQKSPGRNADGESDIFRRQRAEK